MTDKRDDKTGDLFSRPIMLPHNKTETSMAAAGRAAGRAASIRQQIFEYISKRGSIGSTTDEAECHFGIIHQTCSARFNDLVKQKLIVGSGYKRPTRTGSMARVYVVSIFAPKDNGEERRQ